MMVNDAISPNFLASQTSRETSLGISRLHSKGTRGMAALKLMAQWRTCDSYASKHVLEPRVRRRVSASSCLFGRRKEHHPLPSVFSPTLPGFWSRPQQAADLLKYPEAMHAVRPFSEADAHDGPSNVGLSGSVEMVTSTPDLTLAVDSSELHAAGQEQHHCLSSLGEALGRMEATLKGFRGSNTASRLAALGRDNAAPPSDVSQKVASHCSEPPTDREEPEGNDSQPASQSSPHSAIRRHGGGSENAEETPGENSQGFGQITRRHLALSGSVLAVVAAGAGSAAGETASSITGALDETRVGSSSAIGTSSSSGISSSSSGKGTESVLLEVEKSLKSRISTFELANGMRWIVLERHKAPIVSCHTYADVGAADEEDGATGLAHLLEHMAFKGTLLVGTKDAKREAALLQQLDEVFYELRAARGNGNSAAVRRLEPRFASLKAAAAELAVPNEFGALLSRQGGVGLNATTSQDETEYYVSLPSNKLELWMALESGRFISPVFRELYSEKEVVLEERRLRVENSPYGRFTEAFLKAAFPSHPYGRPTIGYVEDLNRIGRLEVDDFFRRNYGPRSLICSVVGDVDPQEIQRLAEKYFGSWNPSQLSEGPATAKWRGSSAWDEVAAVREAAGLRERVRMSVGANPLFMEGYYRPPASSADGPAISILSSILEGSRSSRFYKNLILPGKSLSASASESFPGDKQTGLFLVSAFPPQGGSLDTLATNIHHELDKVTSGQMDAGELERIKKQVRVGLLNLLGSNSSLARLLCEYSASTGDWQGLLDEAYALEEVSISDVQKVATKLFQEENRIEGYAVPKLFSLS